MGTLPPPPFTGANAAAEAAGRAEHGGGEEAQPATAGEDKG
jgi:hypothetical protein